MPLALEADRGAPALLPGYPLHSGNAAGIVAPHCFGPEHLHAGSVDIGQAPDAGATQPQLVVCPLRSRFDRTTVSRPQSQRHSHAVRVPIFSAGPITVSFPYRWPVKSSFFREYAISGPPPGASIRGRFAKRPAAFTKSEYHKSGRFSICRGGYCCKRGEERPLRRMPLSLSSRLAGMNFSFAG